MDESVASKINSFFSGFPLKSYSKGEIIIWSGDDPPGIIYLITGTVSQYHISDSGQKAVINMFKPPAFFPMSWAINKTPNSYFYEAAEAVECHIAPPEEVMKFLYANPEAAFDLLARLYRGMDGLLGRLTELMAGSARTQLLREILISALRFGEAGSDGSISLRIKATDLADRTGMARETVSRELQKLRSEGIITREGNSIIIGDIEKFRSRLTD